MAYDLKNVFYLDTEATVSKTTAGAGSAQLDLSAYVDPIARGRQKGTGLAIYKVHYSIINSDDSNVATPDPSETMALTMSMIAGASLGDNATGAINFAAGNTGFDASNQLVISAATYYGPGIPGSSTPVATEYVMPSKDVPYVIVRDNVCLLYNVDTGAQATDDYKLGVRLECAQVALDQATLNQLLRTQTV
jgi:hypothetical protein